RLSVLRLGDREPGLGEPGCAVVGLDRLPGLRGVGFLAALELGDAEADFHEVERGGVHVALGDGLAEEVDRLGVFAGAGIRFRNAGVLVAGRLGGCVSFGLGQVGGLVGFRIGL